MHDAAYKLIFSRPRMVCDLLDGFAARGWSDALDFDTLTLLPTGLVSEDLQRREGDLVWRVRFRGDRWLYLVLLLEFQAAVDRAMPVRMLAYTALLYQRMIADGALRGNGELPPVLPVVVYNGRRRWTAPVEMTDLVADGGAALARYQPSQRYYLLDGARLPAADLPPGNLVSALLGLEKARGAAGAEAAALRALDGLIRAAGDKDLKAAFEAWLRHGLKLRRPPSGAGGAPARSGETQTMLEEIVREWSREWREQGRAEGVEQGRAEGVEQGIEQERASSKSGRCSAVWRRGSSTAPPPRGWPRRWPASPTRSASPGSATGSSNARRRRTCSPASAATSGRPADGGPAAAPAGRGLDRPVSFERAADGVRAVRCPPAAVTARAARRAVRGTAAFVAVPERFVVE